MPQLCAKFAKWSLPLCWTYLPLNCSSTERQSHMRGCQPIEAGGMLGIWRRWRKKGRSFPNKALFGQARPWLLQQNSVFHVFPVSVYGTRYERMSWHWIALWEDQWWILGGVSWPREFEWLSLELPTKERYRLVMNKDWSTPSRGANLHFG
jgi:hypothetical protein